MSRLGIVTGLAAEAAWARRAVGPAALVACAGGDAARARAAARGLLEAGAGALLSFGLAGGLDPAQPSGRLVLAETVIDAGSGRRFATDAPWRDRLAAAARGADAVLAALAGSNDPVLSIAAKRALFAATGAAAVDMESHAVAAAAAAAGVPFLALRAIADPAGRAVPAAALAGLDAEGRVQARAVLAELLRAPGLIPAFAALALDAVRARAALRRAVALGPGFRAFR
ncbi:MAG TPA: hypothetical protein VJJ77_10120 [Dongiaceae bacterium]|nr:hypothetical protein [Dongiaceae bacterium]